jgi:hypothetical protein
MTPLFGLFNLGPAELIVLAIFAVLAVAVPLVVLAVVFAVLRSNKKDEPRND